MANIIEFEQTCDFCPEQYWARKGAHIIGYIRLRWGHLTCDYLPTGKLSNNDIRVIDHIFKETPKDEYKGEFSSDEERKFWLEKCKIVLLNTYNEIKKNKKR